MLFIRLVVRCLQTNEGERCEQEKKIFFLQKIQVWHKKPTHIAIPHSYASLGHWSILIH